MRFKAILIFFFMAILKVNASSDVDTIIIKTDNSSERIASDLDSLVNTWYVKIAIKNKPHENESDTIGFQCPDSVYISRLSKINSIIKKMIKDSKCLVLSKTQPGLYSTTKKTKSIELQIVFGKVF